MEPTGREILEALEAQGIKEYSLTGKFCKALGSLPSEVKVNKKTGICWTARVPKWNWVLAGKEFERCGASTKTDSVSFNCSKAEIRILSCIADRATVIGQRRMALLMDLEACHCNGNQLDLMKLLNAPDFDFFHDLNGIQHHINRETGKLGNCFSPRCSLK